MEQLKRILHVEDDEDIREIARLSLETVGGFELLQCEDGRKAPELARDFAPQLFLLDVMMPEFSGEETLNALRQLPEYANIPAIFMTAKVHEDEIALCKAWGAVAVIGKPFDPMTLPEQIKSFWDVHQHD